jgi:signal transduction histidine kinase/ActR/RegA family two-component response regulator
MNPFRHLYDRFVYLQKWSSENFGFSKEEVAGFLAGIYSRGDRSMQLFLYCHAVLALLLAFFYDTWLLTIAITLLSLAIFQISVLLLPGQFLTRCIAGVSLQLFVALHIYQLHGLPEMHFFFFTAFTMMLVYQDWLCMWPGALLIIGQHILFAILHNAGAPLFFFPESYVGITKLFFHFGIAIVHVGVCGAWAVLKRRQTLIFARQEADLREATLKAEEAAHAKSSFLAMMSHEIRTPMNAVMGMAQLLLDTPLSGQQREYAEAVRRGADGLLNVINDVLDFSKIEARKLTIHPTPMNLRELLSEIMELLRLGATQKGLRLSFHYPAYMPDHFSGDPSRIRQVTLNLLSNAIKYTDSGSVNLNVEMSSNGPEALVKLSVVDTGSGIAPELQPLLFQEFLQLDRKMTRRHGGTGLGLAITKNLIHLMQGEIGLTSKLNEGTTFWVTIPLTILATPRSEITQPKPTPALTVDAHVLVAEDNSVNRTIIKAFLAKFGCSVETVDNGIEAIERWQSSPYDLIFMDCQMPELDGYEATQKIRSLESSKARIPIIAMTAHAMAGDRELCLEAGMDDYISKPIELATLAAILERWTPVKRASQFGAPIPYPASGSTTSTTQ